MPRIIVSFCRLSSDLYTIDDSLPFILNILLANFVGLLGIAIVLSYVQVPTKFLNTLMDVNSFFLKKPLLDKNCFNAYIYLFRCSSCCCSCHSGISTVNFRYASNIILAKLHCTPILKF